MGKKNDLDNLFAALRKQRPTAADVVQAFVESGANPEALMGLGTDDAEAISDECVHQWSAGIKALKPFVAAPDKLSPEQWVRLGQVYALSREIVASQKNWPAHVPVWFLALQICRQSAYDKAPVWEPSFVRSVLLAGGVSEEDCPHVIVAAFLGVFDGEGWWWARPLSIWQRNKDSAWAQAFVSYVEAHIDQVPQALAQANSATKVTSAEWLKIYPGLIPALAPMVVGWAVSPSKTVRAAAVELITLVDEPQKSAMLADALSQATGTTIGTVADYAALMGEQGRTLLEAAQGTGGKRDEVLAAALHRSQATATPEADFEIPPAPVLDTTELGDDFIETVEAGVARCVASLERDAASDMAKHQKVDKWTQKNLDARAVGHDDVETIRDWLNGRADRPKLMDDLPWMVRESIFAKVTMPLLCAVRFCTSTRKDGNVVFNTWSFSTVAVTETDDDLRLRFEALTKAGVDDPIEEVSKMGLRGYSRSPEKVWPFFAEHPDYLDQVLGLAPANNSRNVDYTPEALGVVGMFPSIPGKYIPVVAQLATGTGKVNRRQAQELLEHYPDVVSVAAGTLADGKSEMRAVGAAWIGRIGDPAGIEPLRAALAKEKNPAPEAAMLNALRVLGEDISAYLTPEVLLAAAKKGLAGKPPAGMAWFPLDGLPACRWAAGTQRDTERDMRDMGTVPVSQAVNPDIVRWWAVLAVKLKDPLGAGLIPLYVSLLDKPSGEALGSFVLDAWIAHDTANPPDEDCRAYAQANVEIRYNQYQDWAKRHPDYYAAQGAMTRDQVFEELRREKAHEYLGSAIGEKGLLALTVGAPGHQVYAACQRYIRDHGQRRAQVEALITAAAGNDDPAAIQLVLSVARKFKQETVRAKAQELAEGIAERTGWSMDELADRTIPTAGFDDDGLLVLDYGPRSFTGRISRSPKTGAFTIVVSNPDGKQISSLPKPGVSDDEGLAGESRKQLTTSKKELGQVVTLQTSRLFEAMCLGRTWDAPSWSEFLLGHPIMAHLVATLVWQAWDGDAYQLFRPTEEGELLDADDETTTLPESARVGLAHLATVTPQEAGRWRQHLLDYEVDPLFSQFDAATPSVELDATSIEDHLGWLFDSFAIRGRATKRGYSRGAAEDGGWFSEYEKDLPGAGIRVVIEFTGSVVPEEKIPAAVKSLAFEKKGRRIPMSDVPPILLAESYSDYVYIAEAGAFDPDWESKSGY